MAYTNVTALSAALELAKGTEDTELVEKLARMLEVASKPAPKSEGMTAEQRQNLALARDVAAWVWELKDAGTEQVTTKFVVQNFGDMRITSTQKAASLLTKCVAQGWIQRMQVKSQTVYAVGELDPRV